MLIRFLFYSGIVVINHLKFDHREPLTMAEGISGKRCLTKSSCRLPVYDPSEITLPACSRCLYADVIGSSAVVGKLLGGWML